MKLRLTKDEKLKIAQFLAKGGLDSYDMDALYELAELYELYGKGAMNHKGFANFSTQELFEEVRGRCFDSFATDADVLAYIRDEILS